MAVPANFQQSSFSQIAGAGCTSIGSTRLARRLCDLSSVGKFGRGGAKAKLPHGSFRTVTKFSDGD